MGCNMYGRRPDCEPGQSRRTIVLQDFSKISLKIFPVYDMRSDSETLPFGRSHVRCK
jgi:hypothetical protein